METADSKHRFTMVWKDNMSKNSDAKIDRTSQHYTRITYKPDLKRFGMDCIDDDSFKIMEKRRTRYRCVLLSTGQIYLVPGCMRVRLYEIK